MRTRIVLFVVAGAVIALVLYDQSFWFWETDKSGKVRQAHAVCAASRDVLPPSEFSSDACSLWPNGVWTECCIEHDYRYWCGGTALEREAADRELESCVNKKISGAGTVMYVGVRAGGHPYLPFPWRWGYGWELFHGYD